MRNLLLLLACIITLSGCATGQTMKGSYDVPILVEKSTAKEFDTIPPPALGKVVVAVYSFTDKTGQRRPSDTQSSFSTAVTQGSDAFLIKHSVM